MLTERRIDKKELLMLMLAIRTKEKSRGWIERENQRKSRNKWGFWGVGEKVEGGAGEEGFYDKAVVK